MTARDDLLARLEAFDGQSFETTMCYNGLRVEAAARIRALEAELSELRLTHLAQMGQAADRYDVLHGVAIGLSEALDDRDGGTHDADCKSLGNPIFNFRCNCGHDDARIALASWEKHNG